MAPQEEVVLPTHVLLWAMAEEYIDEARDMAFVATAQPKTFTQWRARHQELVYMAIKILTAVQALNSPVMTQLDRAKTGLRLARILYEETENHDRAEAEVAQAIILVDSVQGSQALEVHLRLYELQIMIYIKKRQYRLAKNTLKLASSEAEKQGLVEWSYQFALSKAQVHFMMHESIECLVELNRWATFADARQDFDMKFAFWIVATHYSFMSSNWSQTLMYLNQLTPHMGLNIPSPVDTPVTSSAPMPTPPSASNISTTSALPVRECQSKQLRVYFLILYISTMIRIGDMTKATAALTALHAALDEARPQDTDELQGIFKVPIRGTAEMPGSTLAIPIRWMSFSQVYCLTYLISGICHKADLTQPSKAQEFLVEGIKVVDREFNVNDYAPATILIRRNQHWYALLMMNMLLQLLDVFLLKFELASAEDVLLRASYWANIGNMSDQFMWRITLATGMILQMRGRLAESLKWFDLCMQHNLDEVRDPDGFDSKTLAMCNMALIYCGEQFFNPGKVKQLVTMIKARYPTGLPANVQCALHILDSWISVGVMPARQHLQEALRLSNALQNTQMRSLTLLLLGHVYLQSHDDQAERMLSVGFSHAVKTGNKFIASASGSCLQELYLKTAQGIKASQQAELNKQVAEDVDKAFQSTMLAPLLEPMPSLAPPP
ncbi:hypothetical protein BGZ73_007954 [Actinomortierella ambigua]|nr:hypothetical protein BGZ73_007954 [Actinomortierella ambigua]